MSKLSKIAVLFIVVSTLVVPPATLLAADAPAEATPGGVSAAPAPVSNLTILAGAGFGVGLVMLGAGYGIGKIGSCAVESMARQPEVAGNIQTAVIITAAMIEGVTLFALIVCILV